MALSALQGSSTVRCTLRRWFITSEEAWREIPVEAASDTMATSFLPFMNRAARQSNPSAAQVHPTSHSLGTFRHQRIVVRQACTRVGVCLHDQWLSVGRLLRTCFLHVEGVHLLRVWLRPHPVHPAALSIAHHPGFAARHLRDTIWAPQLIDCIVREGAFLSDRLSSYVHAPHVSAPTALAAEILLRLTKLIEEVCRELQLPDALQQDGLGHQAARHICWLLVLRHVACRASDRHLKSKAACT